MAKSTFKERLFAEAKDLDSKIKKLHAFLEKENSGLSDHQDYLLRAQYGAMVAYSAMLHLRIDDIVKQTRPSTKTTNK